MTGGFGKWHMTPDREQGAAGPFEHWPQNWGFNHFWGFLSGAAGQWDPMISQDNTTIGVPEGTDDKPYYFPDDLTDKSVEWLHAVRAQDPEKPWFLYYSTGCAHAPHHVAKEWADKYKGKFDQGWDAIREEVFERQKKLGVIPQDAVLDRAARPLRRVGLARRRLEEALHAADGGLRRVHGQRRLERRPAPRRDRGDGRPRQHADLLHLGRQRREPRGDDDGLVQRDDLPERRRHRPRAAARADRPLRRHRRPGATTTRRRTSRRPGRGPATRRSSGASRWRATWAGRATRWSSPGPRGSRRAATCARSSRTASTSARRSSKRPASRSRRWSTGSSRSRWTARASSTPSTTRTPRSGTPCSTSR